MAQTARFLTCAAHHALPALQVVEGAREACGSSCVRSVLFSTFLTYLRVSRACLGKCSFQITKRPLKNCLLVPSMRKFFLPDSAMAVWSSLTVISTGTILPSLM